MTPSRTAPTAPRRVSIPPLRVPRAAPDPEETERLLSGTHHDPHAVLGVHPVADGVVVRVLRPTAERVVVRTADSWVELASAGDGLYTGVLPSTAVPDRRLVVTYDGVERVEDDGYRMAPTLGELDLHLIAEGRHEQLWRALGSHVRTVDGVAG
ncbi:GlgB N-terminal domain-containing protein, partial [Kitasatospora sp. NE20-6]|uniref:GlgB N-terminal domain-containing protein n=1 Tax=Kitasatospora sp. NE20-6 TaxID=2859066 RepID=UPI0038B37B51